MLAFHIIVPDTICCHRQGPQQVARWQSRASRWPTWKDHRSWADEGLIDPVQNLQHEPYIYGPAALI